MALAYTQIDNIPCANARSSNSAAVRTEERLRQSGVQHVHDELAGVLIGLKACIQVSIQRHRNLGCEPDRLLMDASTLADLAVATIRQLRVDQNGDNLGEMPKAARPFVRD